MKSFCLYVAIRIMFLVGINSESRTGEDYKRLLLNDPSYIQQEIDNLKSLLQTQQNTLHEQQSKIADLESKNTALQNEIRNQGNGAVYTRWGKKQCAGNGTELVYSGYVGGPWYNKPGSGNNPVCLTPDPLWGRFSDNLESHLAYIYGAEYQYLNFAGNLDNENVPCAVCWSKNVAVALMIPGRNRCYPGWNEEYHGYLVANREEYEASIQYTCMDSSPDVLVGGHNNEDGILFESVEGRCGSLPCPPYINGREITCVVCSK